MNDKISITNVDGAKVNGDLICFLETLSTRKKYVYYTLNETVGAGPNSTVKIYVSKIKQNDPSLDTAITEGDWDVLKGYMSDALKGIANPDVKYLNPTELGEPVSVSDRAIAMPTSYDYINKQRGIYAQNIATSSLATEEPAATVAPETTTPVTPAPETAPAAPQTPTVEEPPMLSAQEINQVPTPEVTPTVAPVPEAAPSIESAPVETPAVPETVSTEPVAPAPVEPTPVVPESVTPATTSIPEAVTPNKTNDIGNKLEPIDINAIESKYVEMINSINALRDKEIEAAKRYNATIELSSMHNEQHASYVQNEQIKETAPIAPQVNPFASANPVPTPTPEAAPTVTPAPNVTEAPAAPQAVVEPTPVTPENLETNWFDMPASQ